MPDLTFYRQARVDAGARTGIELEGETIFERFEEGGPEPDPTLLWYVELRCKVEVLPDDPQGARRWLLDHEELIRAGFEACASELEAGRDVDRYPLIWDRFSGSVLGVKMAIACATNRRRWAISIAMLLRKSAGILSIWTVRGDAG